MPSRGGGRGGRAVTLVSGPVAIPDPAGVATVHVESAREMLAAVEAALPADIAIFAAAVADWRVGRRRRRRRSRRTASAPPSLALVENPDILATIARRSERPPALVVGFAAETDHVVDHARAKLARRAATSSSPTMSRREAGVMGGDRNTVHLVTALAGVETWPTLSKDEVARRLVGSI